MQPAQQVCRRCLGKKVIPNPVKKAAPADPRVPETLTCPECGGVGIRGYRTK
jgi:hypothetical protein